MLKGRKIVIFGASKGGILALKALKSADIKIDCFTDNNAKKWGETIESFKIINPKELLSDNFIIVIASIYRIDIKNQLIEMGIPSSNIYHSKDQFILEIIKERINEFEYIKDKKVESLNNFHRKKRLLIECDAGWGLGGIQKLTDTILCNLTRKKLSIGLICRKESIDGSVIPESYQNKAIYYIYDNDNYWETITSVVDLLLKLGPTNIILNTGLDSPVSLAVYIIKNYLKEYLNVIYFIHSGIEQRYYDNFLLDDKIDITACVSNDIKQNMINKYGRNKDEVMYKESPVIFENDFKKRYSFLEEPIVIGYAARLEIRPKRADLLLPIIHELRNRNIKYRLYIAGDGSLYQTLKKEIDNNCYEEVKMLGFIEFNRMSELWKKCDVFINLSDYEGVGLSMLESMSYGVVPLVTKVCGTTEFVDNGVNGFIIDNSNIKEIVDKIEYFRINRNKLKEFGDLSKNKVKNTCNLEDYICYLEGLFK